MSDKDKKTRQKRGVKLFFFPKPQGQKHKHKKNKYYISHRDEWSPERNRKNLTSQTKGEYNMSWQPIDPADHCRFYSFLTLKKFPYLNFADNIWSIMSGDSPTHNNRTAEAFDFSSTNTEGRPQLLESKPLTSSDPVATTSKETASPSVRPEEKAGRGEVQASVLVEPGGKDKDDNDKDLGSPTLNNSESPEETEEDDNRRRANKDDDGSYGGKDKKDRKEDKFKKNGNIDKLDGVWVPKEKKQQDEQDEDNCIVKCLYVTMTCCECSIM